MFRLSNHRHAVLYGGALPIDAGGCTETSEQPIERTAVGLKVKRLCG